jgi:hypothetical protein
LLADSVLSETGDSIAGYLDPLQPNPTDELLSQLLKRDDNSLIHSLRMWVVSKRRWTRKRKVDCWVFVVKKKATLVVRVHIERNVGGSAKVNEAVKDRMNVTF